MIDNCMDMQQLDMSKPTLDFRSVADDRGSSPWD